ncbi:MAG TPA: hypothetical protein VGH19_03275 [Verrucomicrobiae bacterium]
MSFFRILPIIAIGAAVWLGKDAFKENLDVVGKVQNATTSGLEVDAICDLVVTEFLEEGRLPADDFSKFLASNSQTGKGQGTRDRSKDPWGNAYKLKVQMYAFEVSSAGPDAQWGTEDDIRAARSVKEMPGGLGVTPEAYNKAKAVATTTPPAPVVVPRNINPAKQTAEETELKVLDFQRQQAEKGSGYAQYQLGLRYLEGRGVELDATKGREWLEKAAQNGNADAIKKLSALDTAGKK